MNTHEILQAALDLKARAERIVSILESTHAGFDRIDEITGINTRLLEVGKPIVTAEDAAEAFHDPERLTQGSLAGLDADKVLDAVVAQQPEKPKAKRRTKAEMEAARAAAQAQPEPDAQGTLEGVEPDHVAELRAEVKKLRDEAGGDSALAVMQLNNCADLESATAEQLASLREDFLSESAAKSNAREGKPGKIFQELWLSLKDQIDPETLKDVCGMDMKDAALNSIKDPDSVWTAIDALRELKEGN